MPFLNGFSRRTFSFFSLMALAVLLAGLLAACDGNTATGTPFSNFAPTTAATQIQSTTPANSSGAATTVPQANTSAAATSAATTAITSAATTAGGATTSGAATPGQTKLTTAPAVITKANGEKINMTVELARTEQEQETGLMGRLSVPDDTGMLFVFPQSGRVAFWMKDTPLALSIAFITQDGKIIDIQDMESFSLDTHQPNQDYIYALEVAKGYFAKRGIASGDTFTFKS